MLGDDKYNNEFNSNDENYILDNEEDNKEQFYHEDEFNRDVYVGLNRKGSYSGEGEDEEELLKKHIKSKSIDQSSKNIHKSFTKKAAHLLKVGAITSAIVSVVATVSTTHEHKIPNNWTTTIEATCIEYGKEEKICSECGNTIDAQIINYSDHTEGDWVIETPSNCSHTGIENLLCKVCEDILDSRTIPLGDHIEGEWEITTIKTCTTDGEEGIHCSICGKQLDSKVIPASHTSIIDKAVKATCYNTGLTEGSHCSECNEVIEAQKIIPVTHKPVTLAAVKATCTKSGLTEGQKCSECGKVLVEQAIISARHNEITIKGYAADCGQWTTGLTDGKKCADCGTITVAQSTIQPSHSEEVYIPNGWPTSATCTEGVTGLGRCRYCGMETSTYVLIEDALGHNYEERIQTDETGFVNTVYVCSRCGDVTR